MKNRSITIKLMACMLLVLSSCSSFLDEEPQTALTQEQVFADLDKIEPLVLGLYTNWRNVRKDRGGFMFMLGTDESRQGNFQVNNDASQAGLDRYNSFLAPSNTALEAQWSSRWPVISGAATTIFAIKSNRQDPNKKNLLLAEASFIRGALYFEIAQYWGPIPILDLEKLDVYGSSRQPLSEVYGFIINDLETAIQFLPETQSDKRRATRAAAQALLGKVYLYAPEESGVRNYEKARDLFKTVIDNPNFSLVATYSDLWDPTKSNSKESIFSFQFNNVWPDNNQIQWQMGGRTLANAYPNCYFGGYDLMLPTTYAYNNVDDGGVWEDGDLRKQSSIRYDFTYNGSSPPPVEGWMGGDELDPHVMKYEDSRLDGIGSFWYSGKNVYFLRLSDIMLNYAETLNETGNTAGAVSVVNTVRTRAWGGSLPVDKQWSEGMSQTDFRTQILDERIRELCFEGWRRMDLNRYGKLVELVKVRNKWAAESGTLAEFHKLYPIPRKEILENTEIDPEDQNFGYTNN